MSLKNRLEQDIKTAMLAGDKDRTTILKGLKTAVQYAEVAGRPSGQAMSDDDVTQLLAKEAKKRQDSADLYRQGGSPVRAEAEEREKVIIMTYLPTQLSEADVQVIVLEVIAGMVNPQIGQVIGAVKAKAGVGADGAMIARLVKAVIN